MSVVLISSLNTSPEHYEPYGTLNDTSKLALKLKIIQLFNNFDSFIDCRRL